MQPRAKVESDLGMLKLSLVLAMAFVGEILSLRLASP